MSHKRLWFGLATMLLVQLVVGNLASVTGADRIVHVTLESALTFFLAALAGGVVARRGFVLPALGLWLVLWAAIGFILYQIAAPAVEAPLPSLVQYNWVAFLLSGAASGIGAHLGQWLAARGTRRVDAA